MPRCRLCLRLNGEKEVFFGMPNDARMRNIWIEVCNVRLTASSMICRDHFDPSDIVEGRKPRLLPTAVPLPQPLTYAELLTPTIRNQSQSEFVSDPDTYTEEEDPMDIFEEEPIETDDIDEYCKVN